MYHKGAIETYPLQTYASALLFSPTGSLMRSLFQHEEPKEITIKPALSKSWSACLQTLEGHSDGVRSVAFSHDSARLTSASWDRTVKIWDASSGACLQTLEGQSNSYLPSILTTQRYNEDVDESQQSLQYESNISVDTVWISINSQNMLWLPSEYRPSCSTVLDKSIGVGTGHGKVWIGRVK
jgi:WD40 repeat protein